MGSEDELKSLVSFCETNGVGFFPSVELLYVTSTGNGFSASQDAARRMNRSMATIVERMNAIGSLREDLEEKTLLSSKVSVEIAESYKTSFEEVFSTDKKSIALGSLGQGLHSNYKTNRSSSRLMTIHIRPMKGFPVAWRNWITPRSWQPTPTTDMKLPFRPVTSTPGSMRPISSVCLPVLPNI